VQFWYTRRLEESGVRRASGINSGAEEEGEAFCRFRLEHHGKHKVTWMSRRRVKRGREN
jgi:hypothetical protein